jgi:hypothetical protein
MILNSFLLSSLFIFLSETTTQAFQNFLDLLGGSISLKGWDKFKGGLDVKS